MIKKNDEMMRGNEGDGGSSMQLKMKLAENKQQENIARWQ
jgi:hypothetical protein